MRIVIDPGHGGKDPGAVGKTLGIKEKDVNLGIAKLLAEKLRLAKHEVFLTRENDEYISLAARVDKIEEWNADFVLSIHVNSAENTIASYVSTFLADTSDKKLYVKAQNITHACSMAMNWPDGGVRKANFYILRNSKRPTCLVELGFISNPEQEKQLATAAVRRKLADVLYSAINGREGNKRVDILIEGKSLLEGELHDGTTYVPLREFTEALGLNVAWDAKNSRALIYEQETSSKVLNDNEVEIVLIKQPRIAGKLQDGVTIAPVRDLAELLGYKISWDESSSTVKISQ